MNDAQLFVIFFSILVFGWIGFFANVAWNKPSCNDWNSLVFVAFFLGSAGLFISMIINLVVLIQKNF